MRIMFETGGGETQRLGPLPSSKAPREKGTKYVTRMELSNRFMLHIHRHENGSEKVQSQTFTVG